MSLGKATIIVIPVCPTPQGSRPQSHDPVVDFDVEIALTVSSGS